MNSDVVTAELVRELLNYDQISGAFTWRSARAKAPAGRLAGTINKALGYVVIRIGKKLYYAHRLAWLHVTGDWPAATIDHRDAARTNNAFSNLRDVPHNVNVQNVRAARKHSASGVLGANKKSRHGIWRSIITVSRRQHHLGTFATPEEAHAAYVAAKRRLHVGGTL